MGSTFARNHSHFSEHAEVFLNASQQNFLLTQHKNFVGEHHWGCYFGKLSLVVRHECFLKKTQTQACVRSIMISVKPGRVSYQIKPRKKSWSISPGGATEVVSGLGMFFCFVGLPPGNEQHGLNDTLDDLDDLDYLDDPDDLQ